MNFRSTSKLANAVWRSLHRQEPINKWKVYVTGKIKSFSKPVALSQAPLKYFKSNLYDISSSSSFTFLNMQRFSSLHLKLCSCSIACASSLSWSDKGRPHLRPIRQSCIHEITTAEIYEIHWLTLNKLLNLSMVFITHRCSICRLTPSPCTCKGTSHFINSL